MSLIDFSRAVTAEDHAAARAVCRKRILAAWSKSAQCNLAGAAAAGLLTPQEAAHHRAALDWVGRMRGHWPNLAAAGRDPHDDETWPTLPDAVADFLARY